MNVSEHSEEGSQSGWRYYLNIGFRRRWWFISSAVIFWAGAITFSVIVTPRYRSETLVLIEPGEVPAQYVTSNIARDMQQRLQSLTEQTLSQPRLIQLIKEFHLYGYVPGQVVSQSQVTQMRGNISVELTRPPGHEEISAFKISYSGPTPPEAQKVTTGLSSLFIQDSLARQQRVSEDTTSFLQGQLEDARKDLQQRESILRALRSKNLGQLPEQMPGNVQILSGLQDRLQSAMAGLHQAEQQKIYLGSMIRWSGKNTTGDTSTDQGAPTPLDDQIDKMKTTLANLSGSYKQSYPDIVRLKEQIANAEKLKRRMRNVPHSAKTGPPERVAGMQRSQHPVSPLLQLQSQFKANELEIANRKQEINDIEKQIATYQNRLNLGPVREQEIAEATQSYKQAWTHYEALLAKKQQSEMATDLSRNKQDAQFRVIDPPSLPQTPYWPNRLKFSAGGFFFGVLIGFLAVSIKEIVDARIYGEEDLSNSVTAPIIATVPPLTTDAERNRQRRRRRLELALASLLLCLVPALTFAAYLKS